MAALGGPGIVDSNVVFAYDWNSFPKGWSKDLRNQNPECQPGITEPNDHGCFTSGAYLGALPSGLKQGGTYVFSGGDLSNYWATNPEYRGWNAGGIGSTGGNWVTFNNALPATLDATRYYMIQARWRFVYVAKTGNGTANPTFQIGRGYYQFYGKNFYDTDYEWQTVRLFMKGDFGGGYHQLTLGCTSADSAVEVDYVRCYEVYPSTGITDLTGNSTLDLSTATINSIGEVLFDGTNDYISLGNPTVLRDLTSGTIETVYARDASTGTYQMVFTDAGSDLEITYLGNVLQFYIGNSGLSYTHPATGQWFHVVGTWAPGSKKLYINGVEVASGTNTGIDTGSRDRYIGGRGTSFPFNGKIAMVKTYTRTLTTSEISSNFNAIRSRFNI